MSKSIPSICRPRRLALWVAAIGYAASAFLLNPLYINAASNILYRDTFWVRILYYLLVEGYLYIGLYAVIYPITVYTVWQTGVRKSMRLVLPIVGITLLHSVANFFVDGVTAGALPDAEEFLMFDLPMMLGMFLMDVLQYALVILVTALIRARYQSRVRIAEGMKLLPASKRVDFPVPTPAFPFTRLLSLKNPLQRAAFSSALILFVFRAGMHLIYQLALYEGFGSSDGWVYMLYDLIIDTVIAVLFYFVHLLLVPKCHSMSGEPADPAA